MDIQASEAYNYSTSLHNSLEKHLKILTIIYKTLQTCNSPVHIAKTSYISLAQDMELA
jgi:hypothetical protein